MQLLEENIIKKLLDIGLTSDFFLDMAPKAQAPKGKINKWGDNKLKSICTAKEMIPQIKRQPKK